MNANGSVTLQGIVRKVFRHVEFILTKPSHGSEPARLRGRAPTIYWVAGETHFLRVHHC